jgi:transglutaminase-like putative cysteine protease
MKYLRSLFLLAVYFFAAEGFSQMNNVASVTLATEISKKYPDAVAYIEDNKTNISFSAMDYGKGHEQFKIIHDEIIEYLSLKDESSIVISENYDSFSSIAKMIAYTKSGNKFSSYAPNVVDKPYEAHGIFHSDVRIKAFNMYFSSKGYRDKTEISKIYTDYRFYRSGAYFHTELPQKKHTISFQIPSSVEVEIHEFNFEGYNITKNTVIDPKTTVKTVSYVMEDIRPITTESGNSGISANLPHVLPIVKSYTVKGNKTNCFQSFSDLYTFLHKLNAEVEKHPDKIQELVTKITAGKTTDEQKIKALYYWVQDNIRYIAFEDGIAGFKPMAPKDVIEKKYGDCKAMANLLTQMLVTAGYDAKFVWIHTNHSKYDCTLPFLGNFNHAICMLKWDNKTYFLDCTETYAAFGENAYRIQGRPVLIENGDTYKIEKVPLEDLLSSKYDEKVSVKIIGEKLTGLDEITARGDLKNQLIRSYHGASASDKTDYFKKYFSNTDGNLKLLDIETSDLHNREIPFSSKYHFELNNQVFIDGNELFVNLEFDNFLGKNSKDTFRLTDYTFNLICNYSVAVTMDVPAGYKVKHMPEPYTIKNEYCTIDLAYTVVNGKVLYKKTFLFPSGVIPKAKAAEWAKIQKDLKKFYTNQITLSK